MKDRIVVTAFVLLLVFGVAITGKNDYDEKHNTTTTHATTTTTTTATTEKTETATLTSFAMSVPTETEMVVTKPTTTTTTVATTTTVPETTTTTTTTTTNQVIGYPLPYGDNSFMAYMDWRAITTPTSAQYKLQQQAYTDEMGLRKVDDYYCVALGTAFGGVIGTKYIVTMDTGVTFKIVLGDVKADIHTDSTNTYRLAGNGKLNIIEFIVETETLNPYVKQMGNVGVYDKFKGQIVRIENE